MQRLRDDYQLACSYRSTKVLFNYIYVQQTCIYLSSNLSILSGDAVQSNCGCLCSLIYPLECQTTLVLHVITSMIFTLVLCFGLVSMTFELKYYVCVTLVFYVFTYACV